MNEAGIGIRKEELEIKDHQIGKPMNEGSGAAFKKYVAFCKLLML